jgi:arylsulfatase A
MTLSMQTSSPRFSVPLAPRLVLGMLLCGLASQAPLAWAVDKPNIVIMLADDMGFGELQCLNPERGKIKTPQLDALAASGMIFTDAHGGSSVCTPTRYGLMTGRYAWRTRLQQGVVTGGESLIAPQRLTLAKLLKSAGYHTAIIGKWHLGMLFDGQHVEGAVPLGSHVTHGPLDRGGFDEFHGFHHARQIETWIDNDRVTAELEAVEMLPRLTQAAVQYIRTRRDQEQPFFLYVPWSSPHSPVVPSPEWRGRSGLNEHADFVMQTDDSFGQVVAALRETGMLEQTLILCSSDNGTSAPTAKLPELEKQGHFPSGDLRGSKADIWDGGHRVPFLVSWPAVVAAGSRCDQLVCLTDVMATVAQLLEIPLPAEAAEDSLSFLSALRGETTVNRQAVIHHSISGYFAIREAGWKLCLCPDSGGWTEPKPSAEHWKRLEQSGEPLVQLYAMNDDLSEQTNLASAQPQVVARLSELLRQQVTKGRSTPGPQQANDVPVIIDKRPTAGKGK